MKEVPRASQQQQRLEKRAHRLHLRLQQTTSTHQHQRIQRRLKKIQQKQTTKAAPSFLLGVLSMIAGILGLVLLFIAIVSSVALAFSMGASGALIVGIYVALTLAFGITGLILSILYLAKRKKDPTAYTKPAFAIVGMVLSSIAVLFGFILVFGALSTL